MPWKLKHSKLEYHYLASDRNFGFVNEFGIFTLDTAVICPTNHASFLGKLRTDFGSSTKFDKKHGFSQNCYLFAVVLHRY